MPRKAGKKVSHKATNRGALNSDEDDDAHSSTSIDNASIVSAISDASFLARQDEVGILAQPDDVTADSEVTTIDLLEEKLAEDLDMATQKSAQGRQNALVKVCQTFTKRFLPDTAEKNYLTIADLIERALKKGKTGERVAAANLFSALCVQIGNCVLVDEVYYSLRPVLSTLMNDNGVSMEARCAMMRTLGACCFLVSPDDSDDYPEFKWKAFMNSLRVHFVSASRVVCPDLQVAALSSWTLLATMVSPSEAFNLLKDEMSLLSSLLDSVDVDLRIASGEAIVVLFEIATEAEHMEDDAWDVIETVIPKLKQLSTDSLKHRSKKDKKEQKSSFRDILRSIEEGDIFYEKVKISNREVLELDSWSKKRQYDTFCKILGSGTNAHLIENPLLRSIFDLGDPVSNLIGNNSSTEHGTKSKASKLERNLANIQASKYRTQSRGKNRDKRCYVVE